VSEKSNGRFVLSENLEMGKFELHTKLTFFVKISSNFDKHVISAH
jgi:hypothetical protein